MFESIASLDLDNVVGGHECTPQDPTADFESYQPANGAQDVGDDPNGGATSSLTTRGGAEGAAQPGGSQGCQIGMQILQLIANLVQQFAASRMG